MHSREMKISLLSDYVPIIRQDSDANSQPHDNFLVVITAVDDTNEKKEWEGSINAIRKVIDA